jgi:hypothetical protein
LPGIALECRIDSAFYNETIFSVLEKCRSELTCSVPFERFPLLKKKFEQCAAWKRIDDRWSYFESNWKPEKWNRAYRLIFIRQKRPAQRKGPMQLDLFAPRDDVFEYKVIATNKKASAKTVLLFHNGRGSQEKIFGEGKQHGAMSTTLLRESSSAIRFLRSVECLPTTLGASCKCRRAKKTVGPYQNERRAGSFKVSVLSGSISCTPPRS